MLKTVKEYLSLLQSAKENNSRSTGSTGNNDSEDKTCLKEIFLTWQRTGDTGATLIANGLCDNRTVHTLCLWGNHIHVDGCYAVGEMLRVNESLKEVYFQYNWLGDDGVTWILKGLQQNKAVTKLDLTHVNMTVGACYAMKQMLKWNTSLKELILNCNDMFNDGMELIANGLKTNRTLTKLTLFGNYNITVDGCKAIHNMLLVNRALQELGIEYNAIGGEGAQTIVIALANNTTTTTIDFSCDDQWVRNTNGSSMCRNLIRKAQFYLTLNQVGRGWLLVQPGDHNNNNNDDSNTRVNCTTQHDPWVEALIRVHKQQQQKRQQQRKYIHQSFYELEVTTLSCYYYLLLLRPEICSCAMFTAPERYFETTTTRRKRKQTM